jgi:hypothetical protein
MTISSQVSRVTQNGNGSTDTITIPFPVHTPYDDLQVISTVIATGIETVLSAESDWTWSGSADSQGHYPNGGTITITDGAWASTIRMSAYRDPDPLQELDLVEDDSLPVEEVEAAFDYMTMLIQRLDELSQRSLRQPDGDGDEILALPPIAERASKYLAFDSAGDPVAMEAGDGSADTVTATGSTTARSLAERAIEYVNVKDFGALGDDATDDTAAIQAAFDFAKAVSQAGATVVFPRGVYRHTALTLQPTSGQIHVNLLGLGGALAVRLKYTGTGGTALTIKNNTRFFIDNLRISDAGTGAIGLFITSLAVGSSTGPANIKNVYIDGFTKNYVVGEAAGNAASEFTYHNLEVVNGTSHGVEINAANSLNHNFFGLNMTDNAVGIEAVDPDNIYIYGGSATGSTTQDIALRAAGAYGIYGFRSEGANRFLTVGPDASAGAGSPTNIAIKGCRIAATDAADNRAIRLHKAVQADISNNHIADGHVSMLMANTVSAYVSLKGNLLVSSVPYEFEDNNTSTCRVDARGNRSDTASSDNYWPDKYIIHSLGAEKPYGFASVVATTSGGNVTLATGIPAGVKRITINFNGVSLSGTDNLLLQIGDAGGVETTGYVSSSCNQAGTVVNSTAGYIIEVASAAGIVSGAVTLTLMSPAAFLWVASGAVKISTAASSYMAGEKSLTAELTQLIIIVSGVDTFDAGAISVMYE